MKVNTCSKFDCPNSNEDIIVGTPVIIKIMTFFLTSLHKYAFVVWSDDRLFAPLPCAQKEKDNVLAQNLVML